MLWKQRGGSCVDWLGSRAGHGSFDWCANCQPESFMKTITVPEAGDLAAELARRLRESRNDLVRRWLERITARVALTPERIFPTEDLLNHVPLLIDGVAHYLEHPEDELDNSAPVVAK